MSDQLSRTQFLQEFGISRAFLPPVSHGENRGKISKPCKNRGLENCLISFSLYLTPFFSNIFCA